MSFDAREDGNGGVVPALPTDPTGELDSLFDFHGVSVIVDQLSMMYLYGTEITFVEGLQGTGFKFNNPNVKNTCGCGQTFST